MKFIVVGGGDFGKKVIEKLLENNIKVVLVDKDEKICKEIQEKYGIQTINGDARDFDILEDAGIKEVDGIIITTSLNDTNLLIALLAKQYKLDKIFVRISNDKYIKILRKLGFNYLIIPEEIAANYLIKRIFSEDKEKIIEVDNLKIFRIYIDSEIPIIGEKVGNINKKLKNSKIVAVKTNGDIIIDDNKLKDIVINKNMTVYFVSTEKIEEFISKIRE